MNNNPKNSKSFETEYDECNIHGICSISPVLSAIKATIFAYLREMAFYITKVRAFGAHSEKIKNDFIDFFSILITNSEYSEEVLYNAVSKMQADLHEVKTIYKYLCEQNDVPLIFFKPRTKLIPNFKIIDIIKQGQKYNEQFKKNLSEEQAKGFEIIMSILKSICLYIIEFENLDIDINKYYEELLSVLCTKGFNNFTTEKMQETIEKYAQIDHELMNLVFEMRKKEFGEFIETDVSISPKEGKAILVAGSNMKELELLLNATKDTGINIYTHGQMMTGHTFPKLKAFPHLAGHYGKGSEYHMSDFSSFPGPIFLTKLSVFRVETLYSSRIFTRSKTTQKNTTQINEYNFEPLIQAALRMEGFTETLPEKTMKIGFEEKNYYNQIREIINKVKNGEIKNIFTIGVSNKLEEQLEYFKKFFELLKKDCFVLSAYYNSDFENLVFANVDYTFPLLYKALNVFLPLKKDFDLKINVFNTRCEPHTVPNLVNLKRIGVDKVFFHQCSPNLINPALLDLLLEWFNIEKLTTPESDLQKMLSREL